MAQKTAVIKLTLKDEQGRETVHYIPATKDNLLELREALCLLEEDFNQNEPVQEDGANQAEYKLLLSKTFGTIVQPNAIYTYAEVKNLLGFGRNELLSALRNGELPSVAVRGADRYKIKGSDVLRWMDKNTIRPMPEKPLRGSRYWPDDDIAPFTSASEYVKSLIAKNKADSIPAKKRKS